MFDVTRWWNEFVSLCFAFREDKQITNSSEKFSRFKFLLRFDDSRYRSTLIKCAQSVKVGEVGIKLEINFD